MRRRREERDGVRNGLVCLHTSAMRPSRISMEGTDWGGTDWGGEGTDGEGTDWKGEGTDWGRDRLGRGGDRLGKGQTRESGGMVLPMECKSSVNGTSLMAVSTGNLVVVPSW